MRFYISVSAATTLLLASPATAQPHISADLRVSVASTTQKLAGAELDPGVGIGATLAYRLQPHLHVYGGWDWLRFRADQSFAGTKVDFEETGYTLGLRFEHPIRATSDFAYRIEAGGTYKHIEAENEGGSLVADTDHGLGFETGIGLLTPISGSLKLTTMLRYRALDRDFTFGNITVPGSLQYGALEVGLTRRF